MKKIHYLICIAVLNLLLAGCSIEKRHYTSGYHMEWNSHRKGKEIVKPTELQDGMTEASDSSVRGGGPENTVPLEKDQVVPKNSDEALSASVDREPELKSKERFTGEKTSTVISKDVSHRTDNNVEQEHTTTDPNVSDQHSDEPSDSDLLMILLCLILPPVAVFLYFDQVNTTFWVSLILTLLFWIPGVIFAFLVCFGGVEL